MLVISILLKAGISIFECRISINKWLRRQFNRFKLSGSTQPFNLFYYFIQT